MIKWKSSGVLGLLVAALCMGVAGVCRREQLRQLS